MPDGRPQRKRAADSRGRAPSPPPSRGLLLLYLLLFVAAASPDDLSRARAEAACKRGRRLTRLLPTWMTPDEAV
jgi:hypothetical protein